jgi:hypothetical protein
VNDYYFDTDTLQMETTLPGVIIGRFLKMDEKGFPVVTFTIDAETYTQSALATVSLSEKEKGRQVTLVFENNDKKHPIVTGVINKPNPKRQVGVPTIKIEPQSKDDVLVDGERIVLNAEKEIVLRCGKATIMMTRSGKIIIRGAYLLNRSSGVNRIKGGSVQIN